MLTAEHQRPLAAFFLVFAVACLIMGNGLRTQVVDVLIGSGAPRQLITAIAPDMVLGQSLRNAPVSPQRAVEAPVSVEAPVEPAAQAEVVTVTQSRVQAVPRRAESGTSSNRAKKRAARPARPGGGPATAPGVVTPAPTPAPSPAPEGPQAIPGVRVPGIHVPQVPLPGGRSAWAPRDKTRDRTRDTERGNSEHAHARNDGRGSWAPSSRSESVQTREHADTHPTRDTNRGSHDGGDRRWGSGSDRGGWRGDSDRGHRGEARGHGRTDRGQSDRGQTRRGHGSWGGHGRSGHGR